MGFPIGFLAKMPRVRVQGRGGMIFCCSVGEEL
jgi:hypothetical protein